MERTMKRAGLAALALVVGIALPWSAQAADDFSFTDLDVYTCTDDGNVFVVVDPGEGDMLGGCATVFTTGMAALESAGFTVDNPSFIKVINDIRADYVKDGKWWTYYHRHWTDDAGWGDWEFSQLGGGSYEPKPGSVEGWSVSPAMGANVAPRWEGYSPDNLPTPEPTESPTPEPTPTVTVTATPEPEPTVTVTVTAPAPTPSYETAPPSKPSAARTVPYTRPGLHELNGRRWHTTCETYSITERCRTLIWGSTVVKVDGQYQVKQAWVFNNLSYVASPGAVWAGNPLAKTGQWTAADGRKWRTECDTAATGRGACRSYIWATTVSAQPDGQGGQRFVHINDWVVNNIVYFS